MLVLGFGSSQPIHNSQLNKSTAKAQYSFPKAKRINLTPRPIIDTPYYDLPPVRSSRAAGFGYARKFDFSKILIGTPAPNTYRVEGRSLSTNKGITFGMSRAKMEKTGMFNIGEKSSPGPGAYNTADVPKKIISFTFRKKANPGLSLNLANLRSVSPGPAAYNTSGGLNNTGKYFNSKYRDSGAGIISPLPRRKVSLSRDNSPGPGAYEPRDTLNKSGSYFVSKFRSTNSKSFGRPRKETPPSLHQLYSVPGPGSYRLYSEFGDYEMRNTKKRVIKLKIHTSLRPSAAGSQLSTTKSTARVETSSDEPEKVIPENQSISSEASPY